MPSKKPPFRHPVPTSIIWESLPSNSMAISILKYDWSRQQTSLSLRTIIFSVWLVQAGKCNNALPSPKPNLGYLHVCLAVLPTLWLAFVSQLTYVLSSGEYSRGATKKGMSSPWRAWMESNFLTRHRPCIHLWVCLFFCDMSNNSDPCCPNLCARWWDLWVCALYSWEPSISSLQDESRD